MATIVRFLKDHLRHRQGDLSSITDERANYFISCGVAELVTNPKTDKKVSKEYEPLGKQKGNTKKQRPAS